MFRLSFVFVVSLLSINVLGKLLSLYLRNGGALSFLSLDFFFNFSGDLVSEGLGGATGLGI
jgi:hypothetical protein